MELKDKLKMDDLFADGNAPDMDLKDESLDGGKTDKVRDTVLALVSLGYSEFEALKAIKQIPDAELMETEDLLKARLKKMF